MLQCKELPTRPMCAPRQGDYTTAGYTYLLILLAGIPCSTCVCLGGVGVCPEEPRSVATRLLPQSAQGQGFVLKSLAIATRLFPQCMQQHQRLHHESLCLKMYGLHSIHHEFPLRGGPGSSSPEGLQHDWLTVASVLKSVGTSALFFVVSRILRPPHEAGVC